MWSFIVIGGHNSSNSVQLVQVAKLHGSKKSILLENINDFDERILDKVQNIGLTASASAPEILLRDFIDTLKEKYSITVYESDYIPGSLYK